MTKQITVTNQDNLAVATCGNTERFVDIGEPGRVIELKENTAVVIWRCGGSGEYDLDDLFIQD